MSIIEYDYNNPHPAGFVGLRIFVKKVGTKPFQHYFSTKNRSPEELKAIYAEAIKLNEQHSKDAQERLRCHYLYADSVSELSKVRGISVCVVARSKTDGGKRYEIALNACHKKTATDASGSIF